MQSSEAVRLLFSTNWAKGEGKQSSSPNATTSVATTIPGSKLEYEFFSPSFSDQRTKVAQLHASPRLRNQLEPDPQPICAS